MGRYIGRYTYLGSLNFRVRQWKIFFHLWAGGTPETKNLCLVFLWDKYMKTVVLLTSVTTPCPCMAHVGQLACIYSLACCNYCLPLLTCSFPLAACVMTIVPCVWAHYAGQDLVVHINTTPAICLFVFSVVFFFSSSLSFPAFSLLFSILAPPPAKVTPTKSCSSTGATVKWDNYGIYFSVILRINHIVYE